MCVCVCVCPAQGIWSGLLGVLQEEGEQACTRPGPSPAAQTHHSVCAQLGNLWSYPWRWYGRGGNLGPRLEPRRMILEFGVPWV